MLPQQSWHPSVPLVPPDQPLGLRHSLLIAVLGSQPPYRLGEPGPVEQETNDGNGRSKNQWTPFSVIFKM